VVCGRGTQSILRARGRWLAWSSGPSTSPLEAMTRSAVVLFGAIALLAAGASVLVPVWLSILAPPFPPPATLLHTSLPGLVERLGTPRDVILPVPEPIRPAKSVEWAVARGVAVWTFRAVWAKAPAEPRAHPDYVSRCLRLRATPDWVSTILFLPCDAVFEGRVMASNNRWRGP